MPDIFISYSSQDRPKAAIIASSLQAEGFDVWWDGELRAGEPYDEVIEKNLRSAKSVVVLWSKTSAKSKWVRAEATVGERHSTVVPALIEDCERPLRFELIQTADLISWDSDRDDPNWKGFIADINIALDAYSTPSSVSDATPAQEQADQQTPVPTQSVEEIFWSTIKDSNNSAELNAYLDRYKGGQFRDLAKQRLAALSANQAVTHDVDSSTKTEIPRQLVALSVFAITTMVGIVLLVLANAIHIGGFKWAPSAGADQLHTGVKQVGFYYAINWSIAVLLLMPIAWTLIFLAIAEAKNAWSDMVRRGMVVTKEFAPINTNHSGFQILQKHMRVFVIGGMITITVLMTALAMSDHAQVAGQFYGDIGEVEKLNRIDADGYPLATPNIERDWMVASFLSSPQENRIDENLNNAFALTTYILYVGLGIGSLLSFGLVVIGAGAIFMRGVAQNYGLQIIPSLNSNDRHCGFDVMRKFFVYTYAVAFIGCALCYLMGIQNIYLRSPHENIFSLLAVDMGAFQSATNWRDSIDALVGFVFADSVAKGTRNAYAWIFGFFAFAVFIGGFMTLLRQGAASGKTLINNELKTSGLDRLKSLTPKNEQEIRAQLTAIKIWPLAQPSLQMSLAAVGLLVASLIFYKLGVVIIICLGFALFLTLRRSL